MNHFKKVFMEKEKYIYIYIYLDNFHCHNPINITILINIFFII